MKILGKTVDLGNFCMAVASLGLAGLAGMSLTSTQAATELKEQAKVVEARMAPRLAKRGMVLDLTVTRSNLLETTLAASGKSGSFIGGNSGLDASSALTAVAVKAPGAGRCQVYVSAQLMDADKGSTNTGLVRDLGSLPLAWRFILTHEAAHCLPSGGVSHDPSDLIATQAASFLSESFADAYVIGDMWLQDPMRAPSIAQAVANWRAFAIASPSWKTQMAIIAMTAKLIDNSKNSNKPLNDSDIEILAWASAVEAFNALVSSPVLDSVYNGCVLTGRRLSCSKSVTPLVAQS